MPPEASFFHSAVSEGSGLLGFDAVSLGDWSATFRKLAVPSAPRFEGSEKMKVESS